MIGKVNGTQYVVGNSIFVADKVAEISSSWLIDADHIAQAGASPVWIAKNDEIVAVCGISDPLREDAAMVVSYFAKHGWEIGILSGDDARTVDGVGHLLGLKKQQCQGGLLPVQKLSAIQSANRSPVVMVGDGVNDAAALAAADVGVAIRGGASASLTAAPVMIGDGKLSQVIALVQAADSTRRSIRRNFAISIGYNIFAVGLAMTGAITPLIAAVLMPISSISVIAMTLADRTFRESA